MYYRSGTAGTLPHSLQADLFSFSFMKWQYSSAWNDTVVAVSKTSNRTSDCQL